MADKTQPVEHRSPEKAPPPAPNENIELAEKGMAAYLFVDTRAFEKLALQVECRVGKRGALMTGYETYVIEQWACERRVNTVIASYTGNEQHVIEVQVLLVPRDLEKWSPITLAHFEELARMHILPKETPLGNMLVTSLSSLPSNLLLVSLPSRFLEGYSHFTVNENLRRLNVVGRSTVTADPPSESIVSAFRRSFLTPNSVNASYSVLEVVTLMQIALFYYGLLAPYYIDGLLCDYTLKAVESWWASFGRQRFRVAIPRPQDKLYMRVSCAALVGTITGARQRLSGIGLKPPKDPFDAENFVDCIRRFQKLTKITRTSKLDEQTYFKLLQETGKSKALGSSNMLTAMKSTVKEGLSGKVSEDVDDWETLDLDQVAQNARGARAKYLWQNKGSPLVPHMQSALPTFKCGHTTQIPLFSLAAEESDRYSSYRAHHEGSTGDGHENLRPSNQDGYGSGAGGQGSISGNGVSTGPSLTGSNSASVNAHAHVESTLDVPSLADTHESHISLVNMFRKRKQGLGEAFDEAAGGSNLYLHQWKPHDSSSSSSARSPHKDGSEDKDLGRHHNASASVSSIHGKAEHWFTKPGLATPFQKDASENGSSELHLPNHHQSPNNESRHENTRNGHSEDGHAHQFHRRDNSKTTENEHHPHTDLLLPTVTMLTSDDQKIRQPSHREKETEKIGIRRTASLSEIDQAVFPVDSLAPLPKVIRMYDEAKDLQCELKARMERDGVVNEKLLSQILNNRGTLSELQRENMMIKYQVNASTKKRESVRRRVKELEAFMARLDYELAMISVKMKDVNQSVLAFAAKVDAADAKWQQLKTVEVRPWWARWVSSLLPSQYPS